MFGFDLLFDESKLLYFLNRNWPLFGDWLDGRTETDAFIGDNDLLVGTVPDLHEFTLVILKELAEYWLASVDLDGLWLVVTQEFFWLANGGLIETVCLPSGGLPSFCDPNVTELVWTQLLVRVPENLLACVFNIDDDTQVLWLLVSNKCVEDLITDVELQVVFVVLPYSILELIKSGQLDIAFDARFLKPEDSRCEELSGVLFEFDILSVQSTVELEGLVKTDRVAEDILIEVDTTDAVEIVTGSSLEHVCLISFSDELVLLLLLGEYLLVLGSGCELISKEVRLLQPVARGDMTTEGHCVAFRIKELSWKKSSSLHDSSNASFLSPQVTLPGVMGLLATFPGLPVPIRLFVFMSVGVDELLGRTEISNKSLEQFGMLWTCVELCCLSADL